jgi:uncharacterized protein (TIGR03435 family)
MRHLNIKVVLVLAIIATAVMPLASQTPPAQKPAFEVASVKANVSGDKGVLSRAEPGGRTTIKNATLKLVMEVAYSVHDFQIFGGPSWITTDRWDIEAKAEEGSIPPELPSPSPTTPNHPLTLMLQSLIEDRFQLKIHREIKEMPVYALMIAKTGQKMKLSADQDLVGFPALPQGGTPPRGMIRLNAGRGDLEGNGVPLSTLAQVLSAQLGRSVIDKTDVKGLYDFKLEWAPDPGQGLSPPGVLGPPSTSADISGPSIFTALQEQLGLRLDSAKGPVEVLVIDSVQKPSEN